jgi:peptidoglycan/LPS O-acetylase OafA/YrhL
VTGFSTRTASEVALLAQFGVDVFFVISGFLITHLLLLELDATGTVSLRRFYLRRFFRIFPPFYVYLGVLAILWAAGAISLHRRSFICAATFTQNYNLGPTDWLVAHCWSLSLEEQFYVLWPPCLALLGRKKSTILSIGIIALSPLSRLISTYLAPQYRGQEGHMLHTQLDTIMFGCAIALFQKSETFDWFAKRFLRLPVLIFAGFFLLIASPILASHFEAPYIRPFGYTLIGVCVSIILVYVVRNPMSPPGRVLNNPVVRHVGVISYSLYLWQQLFTGLPAFWFPGNLLMILACAEASFFFVERPAFRLRDLLQSRLRFFSKPGSAAPQTARPSV